MADLDPRVMKVTPRLRYNTIGGINGPLVIVESVGAFLLIKPCRSSTLMHRTGQIPQI